MLHRILFNYIHDITYTFLSLHETSKLQHVPSHYFHCLLLSANIPQNFFTAILNICFTNKNIILCFCENILQLNTHTQQKQQHFSSKFYVAVTNTRDELTL